MTIIDIVFLVVIVLIVAWLVYSYLRTERKFLDEGKIRENAINYLSKEILLLEKEYKEKLKHHKLSLKQYTRHKIGSYQQYGKVKAKAEVK
jgi:hypothetical protein